LGEGTEKEKGTRGRDDGGKRGRKGKGEGRSEGEERERRGGVNILHPLAQNSWLRPRPYAILHLK